MLNAIHDVRTSTGRNMRFIMLKLGLAYTSDINEQSIENCDYNLLDPDEDGRVNVLRNVVDIKHGVSVFVNLICKYVSDIYRWFNTL